MTEPTQNQTSVDRTSQRDLVITRTFNAPVATVFAAWTQPELLMRWWLPKSCGITFIACETDPRTGGTYRFTFGHPASDQPMSFFGKYTEVIPNARLVWTNDEGEEPGAITTVTFEQEGPTTRVTMHDLYPTQEALDDAIASGSTSGFSESFNQQDELLVTLNTKS